MEQNSTTVEDISVNVFSVGPCQPNGSELPVSEDDKAGATLLFSGIFLGIVGITFTVMGWVKYEGVIRFVWTQLLGPILLSVGVTFLLIAVCKFKMVACKPCNQSEERVSDMDRMPSGHSFIFTGISQPITFHGARVVQYIPSSLTQEAVGVDSVNERQVLSCSRLRPFSGSVIPAPSPPHYNNVNPQNTSVFSVGGNHSAYLTVDSRSERSAESLEEPEEMLDEELGNNFSPPPYEKLFPPSS
ncbi:transmembrane protein 174-like isoform X4 [Varanus komodoensis]|uniref:Transmembrane protein 174 n=1 Tax=Varanus komodoensis TaxID=61221 RepID=A0A8D2INM4_VARKO|nr:transmembrane protein 174-like isoform X4 [Varanus komodoensis]